MRRRKCPAVGVLEKPSEEPAPVRLVAARPTIGFAWVIVAFPSYSRNPSAARQTGHAAPTLGGVAAVA